MLLTLTKIRKFAAFFTTNKSQWHNTDTSSTALVQENVQFIQCSCSLICKNEIPYFSKTNKCDIPWPLLTKFCHIILVASVTVMHRCVVKYIRHDVRLCYNQNQLWKYHCNSSMISLLFMSAFQCPTFSQTSSEISREFFPTLPIPDFPCQWEPWNIVNK